MLASEYPRFFEFETRLWWFRGLHSVLGDIARGFDLGPSARVLDAGCGTGGLVARLKALTAARVYGFDINAAAAPFWARRDFRTGLRASAEAMPMADETFDAVFCINVFECHEVEPLKAYHEMWRVTKPGGHIVVSAPGHHWLASDEHDEAVNGSRRFTRGEFAAIFHTRPVVIERNTHLFAPFLPIVAAWRLAVGLRRRLLGPKKGKTDLSPLPAWINGPLYGVTQVERAILRHVDLPFGSSVLCVLRKD